jgi:hypothetical protein
MKLLDSFQVDSKHVTIYDRVTPRELLNMILNYHIIPTIDKDYAHKTEFTVAITVDKLTQEITIDVMTDVVTF